MSRSEKTPATGSANLTGGQVPETVLDVTGLSTHFTSKAGLLSRGGEQVVRAVDEVTFNIRRGEIFGLVGESGSGKTTLGRSLLGLVRATGGSAIWKGKDLTKLNERDFRSLRRQMTMIFQDPNASLNPAMTIAQGVGHPLRIHGLTSNRADTRAAVVAMLERCGLAPAEQFLDRYPEDLSGGQKQRAVIARALITNPEFVVADEPVAALDMSVRAKVLELMIDLKDELGLTYLYITHDLASGRFVCDRMAIMYLGQMVEWGDAASIYDDPQHPYSQALLDAIPLPDPTRRGRDRALPSGEIPDATNPPRGCSFHPRCPRAFESCGWEGRDLLDAMEHRWTRVPEATFERELGIMGDLPNAQPSWDLLRLPHSLAVNVRSLLDELRNDLPPGLVEAVVNVQQDGEDTVVAFGAGPEPAMQDVAGRHVACHLHGVTSR